MGRQRISDASELFDILGVDAVTFILALAENTALGLDTCRG
jgi:hypothetical protein